MGKSIRSLCTLSLVLYALQIFAVNAELSDTDRAALLGQHNAWRAEYKMPPLVWDHQLAVIAQAWADELSASGRFEHRPNGAFGENIWSGTAGKFSMASVVDRWGDEREYYDMGSSTCTRGKVCGHFTQVVWWNSSRLGCGKATGTDGYDLVVCNYDPPGNFTNQSPFGQ